MEIRPALAAAHGNPDKLQRVLFNLIQNAIHHTPPDGSVTVRAKAVGDAIEIEVADTGLGIAREHRRRVFEPFYRADGARSAGGAGLGLAVSRAIVEAHGGSTGWRTRPSEPACGSGCRRAIRRRSSRDRRKASTRCATLRTLGAPPPAKSRSRARTGDRA